MEKVVKIRDDRRLRHKKRKEKRVGGNPEYSVIERIKQLEKSTKILSGKEKTGERKIRIKENQHEISELEAGLKQRR